MKTQMLSVCNQVLSIKGNNSKGIVKEIGALWCVSGVSYLTGTGSACMHKAFWILFSVLVEDTLQNLEFILY